MPPAMSSTERVPSRAFFPSAAIPFSIPEKLSWSALRNERRGRDVASSATVSAQWVSSPIIMGLEIGGALAEHGHDEALGGAYGHGDVIELAVDNVCAVNHPVHSRHLQRNERAAR